MEGATDYEAEGSLKNPVNQVIGVSDAEVDAEEVIRSLDDVQEGCQPLG
jgi:hypothetical protein